MNGSNLVIPSPVAPTPVTELVEEETLIEAGVFENKSVGVRVLNLEKMKKYRDKEENQEGVSVLAAADLGELPRALEEELTSKFVATERKIDVADFGVADVIEEEEIQKPRVSISKNMKKIEGKKMVETKQTVADLCGGGGRNACFAGVNDALGDTNRVFVDGSGNYMSSFSSGVDTKDFVEVEIRVWPP